DERKVGQRWDGLRVLPAESMEEVLRAEGIEIVIVAVPAEAAQGVVDRVVAAGVRGMLNFATTKLDVPPDVALKRVDMTVGVGGGFAGSWAPRRRSWTPRRMSR